MRDEALHGAALSGRGPRSWPPFGIAPAST
jgi:hypothetical protein